MRKLLAGVALASLLISGQVVAQEATAPVGAPVEKEEKRPPTLGFSGLGDAGPVLLTGLLGAAVIGGIVLLGDDDDTNATGDTGGGNDGDGGNAGNASDIRLKRDIRFLGTLENGLRIHEWRYTGGTTTFTGVMAQEMLADPRFAGAVTVDDGFYRVDYRALGIAVPNAEAMRREGNAAIERASR